MSEPDPPFFLDPKFSATDIAAYQRRKAEEAPAPNGNGTDLYPNASNLERWLAWGLTLTDKGAPILNMSNAAKLLERDPRIQGIVWFDEFLGRLQSGSPPKEWGDKDVVTLQRYMQEGLGISRMPIDAVKSAVLNVAFLNVRNEVKDWFETLEWDEISRINHFFPDHFGTPESEYSTAVSRNFWLTMVARVYKPGCKVDNMVILEGKQGKQKSSALQIVGGRWYAEQNMSVRDPQKFAENLQGKLVMEIGEMDSFHGVEMTRVKQTVSCTADRYREPWGHYSRDHPRQGIFAGTTNKDDWNRDETGARRFWPITCPNTIDLEGISTNRTQLFAEAVERFKANEKWWLVPDDEAEAEQRARYIDHPWDQRIDTLVQTRSLVTTSDLLAEIGVELSRQTMSDKMRVAARLVFLGFERITTRIGGVPTKAYKRGGNVVTGGNENS